MDQDKKFKCDKCGKAYKFKSILLLHSMRCDEISQENRDDPSQDMETIDTETQKNRMKDKEYTVLFEHDSSQKYHCNTCEKTFNTIKLVLQHHYNFHKEKKFKCEKCERFFPFKSIFKNHIKTCKGVRKQKLKDTEYVVIEDDFSCQIYKCKTCEKTFSNSNRIFKHIYQVHKERKFKCENCGKAFSYDVLLRRHKNICNGSNTPTQEIVKQKLKDVEYSVLKDDNLGRMYQCKKCEKSFHSFHMIHQHIFDVHRGKKLRCEHCDKLFSTNSRFAYHKKMYHSNEGLTSKCEICDNTYKNPYVLRVHFNESHRERKFKCEKCNEMFPFKSSLEKHSKKCNCFRKQIQSKQTLKGFDYDVMADGSGRIYKCQRCEKKFRNNSSIVQHVHYHHREKKIDCEKCGRMFPSKSLLNRHMKSCDGVEKIQQKLKHVEYRVSENDSSDKKYQCMKCEKKFRTINLIWRHIFNMHREKKFRCEFCDKLFPFNYALNTHKKKCHNNPGTLKSETKENNRTSPEDVRNVNDSESIQNIADIAEKVHTNNFGEIEIKIDDDVLEIYS